MIARIAPLLNGTYTIIKPTGEHRTLRIRNAVFGGRPAEAGKPGAKGEEKRVLELLVGPNNESDFEGFAFVSDRGVAVWTRKRGDGPAWFGPPFVLYPSLPASASEHQRLAAALVDLAWDDGHRPVAGSRLAALGFRVELATDCIRCGRTLTTPESIDAGIGPECFAKRNGG